MWWKTRCVTASVPALARALLMFSVPLVAACIRPPSALVTPPVIEMPRPLGWLAVIVPWLTRASPVPAPI